MKLLEFIEHFVILDVYCKTLVGIETCTSHKADICLAIKLQQ